MILVVALCPAATLAQDLDFDFTEEEPTGTSSLNLKVEPERLVLGTVPSVAIAIEIESGGREISDFQLVASVGTIEDLQSLPGGTYLARFHPPEKMFPQIAIIAATARVDGTAISDWFALPLVGQGELPIPGRPGSEVTLRVGEQSYGPVVVGEDKVARIRVEVPPGIRHGYVGRRKVDLGAVPFGQILMLPVQRLVAAGGVETELRIFAVTEQGQPLEGAPLQVSAGSGQVGKATALVPGVYKVVYGSPNEVPEEPVEIHAVLAKTKHSRSSCWIEVVDPALRKIVLTVQPELHIPGEPPPVARAVLADATGNPIDGVVVFETSVGSVGEVRQERPGHYVAQLQLPTPMPVSTVVEVRAILAGTDPPVSSSATVEVAAGTGPVGATITDDDTGPRRARQIESRHRDWPQLDLGFFAGFESNFVALNAPLVAGGVRLRGPQPVDDFLLRLELGVMYQYGESELSSGPLAGRSWQRHLVGVPLTLAVEYEHGLWGPLSGVAALGGRAAYGASMVGDQLDQLLYLGVLGELGIRWMLGPGAIVTRLRYGYGGLDLPYGGLSVLLGYSVGIL